MKRHFHIQGLLRPNSYLGRIQQVCRIAALAAGIIGVVANALNHEWNACAWAAAATMWAFNATPEVA
jgi:hypothetical protein